MPTLTFQTRDDKNKAQPFIHGRVFVMEITPKAKKERVVFSAPLDSAGRVRLPERRKGKEEDPKKARPRVLRLVDLDGEVLWERTLEEAIKEDAPISVDGSTVKAKLTGSIGDGRVLVGGALGKAVVDRLKARKISSLQDLRGDLSELFKGLKKDEREQLERLKAHADLHVVVSDPVVRNAVIDLGLDHPFTIARFPQHLFVKRMAGSMSAKAATDLYTRAKGYIQLLANADIERRVTLANGFRSPAAKGPAPAALEKCDCQSALTPLAYLTDLLDYAVTNMTYLGNELALGTLEQHFLQPFSALPTDCDAWQQLVRQVRLCIEVLRAKALSTAALRPGVEEAVATYATTAYQQLLLELGTSSQELRALRSATADERERSAAALGIAEDKLNSLILLADDRAVERVFGLQAVQRDPLSTGVLLNDDTGQLVRWQLHGVVWNRTTDVNGHLYLTLRKTGAKHILSIYQDAGRSVLLASGESTASSATVELVPQDGSGLTGRVRFAYTANNTSLEIAAIPELAAWRLAQLHARWPMEDHPTGAFDAIAHPDVPLVDPDLLTDADFMRPFGGVPDPNKAHALLVSRKRALEDRRAELDLDAGVPRTIAEMVGTAGLVTNAWPLVSADLSSNDPVRVQQRINELEALHLTPEHFVFLSALRLKEAAGEAVLDTERQQCLDVLVRREKQGLFVNWRAEEDAQGIALDGRHFRLPVSEPVLDPIRADAGRRAQWRYELERNGQRAIIDPDLFPMDHGRAQAWMVSDVAATVLDERRDRIERTEGALRAELNAIRNLGSENGRRTRFNNLLMSGDRSDAGVVVFHALGFESGAEIISVREAIAAKQPLPLDPGQYGLTAGELVLLFELRTLMILGNSDAQDLEQVMHLLVRAEKRRWLDPVWRAEERGNGVVVSPVHVRMPTSYPALREWLQGRSPAFLALRDDARARRELVATLEARLEQERSCAAGLQAAIDRVEERTLPALRDALVSLAVPDANGADLVAKKSWVTNFLLIDTHEGGCRKTTRVGQAIETLQLLIWGRRTGFFENNNFRIAVDQEVFEADWKWLGSYATWRSAMFVFLYPEDLMRPSLLTTTDVLYNTVVKALQGQLDLTESDEEDNEEDAVDQDRIHEEAIKEYLKGTLGDVSPTSVQGLKKIIAELLKIRISVLWQIAPGVEGAWRSDARWQKIIEFTYWSAIENDALFGWIDGPTELRDRVFLIAQAGMTLQGQGQYEDALWFYRGIYDDITDEFHPRIEELLATHTGSYDRTMAWLQDPLNPFAIAATRKNAEKRYILITVLKCILEYAESEFAKDTGESLAKARELYDRAYRLMAHPLIAQQLLDGQSSIGRLTTLLGDPEWIEYDLEVIADRYGDLDHFEAHEDWREIEELLRTGGRPPGRDGFRDLLDQVAGPHVEPMLEQRIQHSVQQQQLAYAAIAPQLVFANTVAFASMALVPQGVAIGHITGQGGYWTRPPRYTFCIPPNPLLIGFRMRVDMGQFKLRNCMNIAGMKREVPVYAAATDNRSGMPVIGPGGSITIAPPGGVQPTQYRYRVLLERAKQLVALAQQLEGSYLSFLEREEAERYQILKARQDLGMAGATVVLQGLRVTEALNGQTLANEQFDRAEAGHAHYTALIEGDLLGGEMGALTLMWVSMGIQFGIAAARGIAFIAAGAGADISLGGATFGTGSIGAAIASAALDQQIHSGIIGGLSSWSSAWSTLASYERREQEWEFQKELASIDMRIAEVQQSLALDRYNIVAQEKRISELGQEHAQDTVNFLQNKFTNAELYDFMADVVGAAYKYMLQEATSVALMAQRQLAFERQNGGVDLVIRDYWSSPNSSLSALGDNAPDRRGMTGGTRLLQDLTKLDQFAFTTDKRRHQISRTISLAMLDPMAFQMFRSTGVLPFATPMELFDRDFPGHYLRLIKRVRVSVFALVPPADGVKATLSASGTSRVVRGPEPFEEATIVRDPECVALSGTTNASGLFELQEQSEMLLPFEGSGVATSWELSMPKASNRFDFNTIADIFLTIDYTAYESSIYRAEVVERLGTAVSLMRPFSLRNQFADAWYDLHHPELLPPDQPPLTARFTTRPADFPPNVSDLRVREVELYVALQDGTLVPLDLDLRFKPTGAVDAIGGPATTNTQNMAGTRTGNAASWTTIIGRTPTGDWTLRFDDVAGVRELFKEQRIRDVLFAITYSGETPPWPT